MCIRVCFFDDDDACVYVCMYMHVAALYRCFQQKFLALLIRFARWCLQALSQSQESGADVSRRESHESERVVYATAKSVLSPADGDGAVYSSVSAGDSPLYAPIDASLYSRVHSDGASGSGEIVYASALPKSSLSSLQPPPPIEDLYAVVTKSANARTQGEAQASADILPDAAPGLEVDVQEDIYSTIEAAMQSAPAVPTRAVGASLVPPTMRVHVEDKGSTEDAYELLPWQLEGHQEVDVDEVACVRRAHTAPMSTSGPALPPRKASELFATSARAPDADTKDVLGEKRSKSERKRLKLEQKKEQKKEQKEQKKEQKLAKAELKNARAAEKANAKNQKKASKEAKKLQKKGDAIAIPGNFVYFYFLFADMPVHVLPTLLAPQLKKPTKRVEIASLCSWPIPCRNTV
eukprot:m.375266 g.375266  ORF g.375266 m.375266 type:complete len:407 (-) comp20916_c0_seq4:235-1455(-)